MPSEAGTTPSRAEELPGRVVDAVRRAAAGCPALRRVWALLSRDLLALLTGLRPAVMLDYITGAPEQALCSVVRDVTSLSETAGVRLVLAGLDGCCYMLRPDLLLARVADRRAVRWISFAANGHVTCCHWATEAESEAVHKQLVAVTAALQLFCERGCASEKGVFRLGALSGAPIMPTLSGWMLGYPVAYLVDAANVGAAASWLSCADLALHRVNAVCSQLQRAVAKVGSISASSRADLDVLCSFTVPAELLSGGGADLDHHLEGWVKGIAGGMGGSGIVNRYHGGFMKYLWDPVRVEVSVSRHSVVL